MKKSQVIFDKQALFKDLFNTIANEQTLRLIEYAKEKIIKIGDKIQTYNSRNHMDRTGNLLNSLCWYVAFDGEMQSSGFYREESYQNKGVGGGSQSWLHEFLPDSAENVYGRKLANEYLTKHQSGNGKGWKVTFAVLAPYWAYWEQGFKMKSHFGGGTQFLKFAVMSEFFDELRTDLKPYKEVTFTISTPKYSYKSNKYRGRNRRIGYKTLRNREQHERYLSRNGRKKKR